MSGAAPSAFHAGQMVFALTCRAARSWGFGTEPIASAAAGFLWRFCSWAGVMSDLDRAPGAAHPSEGTYFVWAVGRSRRRHCLCRRGRLDVAINTAVMSYQLP
jgi:hypothetical protein